MNSGWTCPDCGKYIEAKHRHDCEFAPLVYIRAAFCSICGQALNPAPAKWDGEPTFVGYLPCPVHSNALVKYTESGTQKPMNRT